MKSKIFFCLAALLLLSGGTAFGADESGVVPTPPLRASLQVNVLSNLGKPVAGVEVYIYSLTPSEGKEVLPYRGYSEVIRAPALSSSLFKKEVPPGSYRVEVNASGWMSEVIKDITLSAGDFQELEVKLKPGSVVGGQVVDGEGKPLPGARVKYWLSGFPSIHLFSGSRETETDSDGCFRLTSLKTGIYSLRVSHPGYEERSLNDVVTGSEDLKVVLQKGFIIRGKLEGEVTGLGPTVRLEVKAGRRRESSRQVEVDEGFNFSISDLKVGDYDLRLRDGDYLSDWVRNVRAESSPPEASVRLTVYRGASLSGRVVNSRTGSPLEGVQISLVPLSRERGQHTGSDAEGSYRFRALTPGEYELKARWRFDSSSECRVEKKISLSPGESRRGFDFEIDPGRKVDFKGTVVDEKGSPVAEAEIGLHCQASSQKRFHSSFKNDTSSDSSGRFSFSNFIEGEAEVKLSARKEGFAPTQSETMVLLPGQDSVDGIVLQLLPGTSLRVEVVDEEEKSVPAAKVVLKPDWSAVRKSVTLERTRKELSDVKGIGRFERLPPGPYLVEVAKDGYVTEERKLELEEAELEKSLRVTLPKGKTLRVFVRDSAGDPVGGARVWAQSRLGFRYIFTSGEEHETDSQGLTVIADLPRKPILLSAAADNYSPIRRQRVGGEEEEAEIVLLEAGSISGRLLGPGRRPVEEMDIRARLQKQGPFELIFDSGRDSPLINQGEGYFVIKDLRAGQYSLKLKSSGLGLKKLDGIEVRAGEETALGEISLEAEAIIAGQIVRGEDGSPLPRAWIRIKGGGMAGLVSSRLSGDPSRFELKNLSPGTYSLVVGAHNYREKEIGGITVSAGERKELPRVELEEITVDESEERDRQRNLIPSIGIKVGKIELEEDLVGIPVAEVEAGAAAATAGIKAGDTIIKVNGKEFWEDPAAFVGGIMGKPGAKLSLTVKGVDLQQEEVEITIDNWDYEKMLEMMKEY